MKILIRPKDYQASQIKIKIFEHSIYSILTFVCIYIGLFYLTLKGDVKSKSKNLDFLLTHPLIYYLICLTITVFVNIVLFVLNTNKVSIRQFEFDDESKLLEIKYKKGYSEKEFINKLPYSTLKFKMQNNENFLGEKTKLVTIFSNKMSFRIDISDSIWSSDNSAIRDLLEKIQEFEIKKHTY